MQEGIKFQNEHVLYEEELVIKKSNTMPEKKTITLIAAAAENDALGKEKMT